MLIYKTFLGQAFQYYDTGQGSLPIQHQSNNFEREALQVYPQYREGMLLFSHVSI